MASSTKKQNLHLVEYVLEPDGRYTLYTCDPDAARAIGARFDRTEKCYVSVGKKAPVGRPYHRQFASDVQLASFRREFEKLEKMEAVVDKMRAEITKQEEKLVKALQTSGVNLKPGKPLDRQLMASDDARLHNCQSVVQWLDTGAATELSAKYPQLAKCLVEITTTKLDRMLLHEVLPELPALVSRQIQKFDTVESLKLIPLTKPECRQCGGKLRKDGYCRRCEFQEQAPQSRTLPRKIKRNKAG